MHRAFRFFLLFFIFSINSWAATPSSHWYTQQADGNVIMQVDLFLSSTCPHCHKVDVFFQDQERKKPWLHVTRYLINQDKSALIYFNQLLTSKKMDDFVVPSVFFCNSRWVGFASPETTGNDLLRAINYCKQQIEKKGDLNEATMNVLKRWGGANLFDSGIVGNPSPKPFLVTLALMDAFNPCALFCIMAFFAFLFIQQTRKERLISGLLFIMGVVLAHYFQQVYSSTFFELLPWLRLPAVIVALFTFYVIGNYYKKNMFPNYFFCLPLVFALIVQFYQQTCVLNWAYIFEQWLYNQHLSSEYTFIYHLIYQVIYILPLSILLVLYLILIDTKFFATWKPRLKIIGLLLIVACSLFLMVYPLALARLFLSGVLAGVLSLVGWFLSKKAIED